MHRLNLSHSEVAIVANEPHTFHNLNLLLRSRKYYLTLTSFATYAPIATINYVIVSHYPIFPTSFLFVNEH